MQAPLSDSLAALLPGATIICRGTRRWQSAAVSATQLVLEVGLTGPGAAGQADLFSRMIGDHEFSPDGPLVADIAVMERRNAPDAIILTVEALLLDAEV